MANIVKTYSFVNGTPADGTQVNKNFDDIIAGVGDISTAGHALIDDATAAAQLTTLGVTAAAKTILDDATVGAILATIGGMPSAAGTVTLAQMADLELDRIIGRATSPGVPQVIACTAAGRAIIGSADRAAQLVSLGLSATAEELNVLDGILPTVTELNYVDGVTSAIQTQLNAKVTNATHTGDVTGATALTIAAGAVDLEMMANLEQDRIIGRATTPGVPQVIACTAAGRALIGDATAAAQLITLGVTSTAAELNALDGITPTVTELNYVDGVTSAIQTQLNAKKAITTGTVSLTGETPNVVTHGLGTIPSFILVTSSNGTIQAGITAKDSNTFTIQPVGSTAGCLWIAVA